MNNDEIFFTMALTRISNFNYATALELYRAVGSAQLIFEHRHEIGDILQDCSPRLMEALKDWDEPMKRAEAELEYMQTHGIRALTLTDEDYPQRLSECPDAPIILYYKGNADLNQSRIISIVGTRHCTTYGQDIIRRFIEDLHRFCPQVLVVSGLAYGVDINAHREALANGYPTVGVLAHGLDQIYPYRHRDTAAEMLRQGGLLTEFMTQTNADKPNFVRRNRIVAGMADATIVVESAKKGGSLITAEITEGYGRDVFAFPGRIGDTYSEGCNMLIKDNHAGLITCAEDFAKAMGWETEAQLHQQLSQGLQQELFPDLTEEEQRIVKALTGADSKQINILAIDTVIPISRLTSLLFNLEMKGVVRLLSGGCYRLAK